jgi:hypothetical protein
MVNVKRADPPVVEIGDFDEVALELSDTLAWAAFLYEYVRAARVLGIPLKGDAIFSVDLAIPLMGIQDLDPNENRMIFYNHDYGSYGSMNMIVDRDLPSMSIIIV